jgi:hypothetical protein
MFVGGQAGAGRDSGGGVFAVVDGAGDPDGGSVAAAFGRDVRAIYCGGDFGGVSVEGVGGPSDGGSSLPGNDQINESAKSQNGNVIVATFRP